MVCILVEKLATMLFIVKDAQGVYYEPICLIFYIFDDFLHVWWEPSQVLIKDLLRLVDFFSAQVNETASRDRSWCDIAQTVSLKKKAHTVRQVDRLTIWQVHFTILI